MSRGVGPGRAAWPRGSPRRIQMAARPIASPALALRAQAPAITHNHTHRGRPWPGVSRCCALTWPLHPASAMVRRLPVPRSSLRAWMEPVRLGWALVTPHAPGHGRGLVSSLLHHHHGGKCPTFIRHQSTVDRLVKLSGTTEPVGSASAYDADGTQNRSVRRLILQPTAPSADGTGGAGCDGYVPSEVDRG